MGVKLRKGLLADLDETCKFMNVLASPLVNILSNLYLGSKRADHFSPGYQLGLRLIHERISTKHPEIEQYALLDV